jgi:hypothetical protein
MHWRMTRPGPSSKSSHALIQPGAKGHAKPAYFADRAPTRQLIVCDIMP